MLHYFMSAFARIALLASALSSSHARASEFVLRARPVEALAGGPVAVKLSLQYQGATPILVSIPVIVPPHMLEVTAPKSWVKAAQSKSKRFTASLAVSAKRMRRGDTISSLVFLHHLYAKLPAGKADLTFRWRINPSAESGRTGLTTIPQARCKIDLLPATPENLKAARRRILDGLMHDGTEWTADKHLRLAQRLIWTDHPEVFVPLCFRYLTLHPPDNVLVRALMIDYLVSCGKSMLKAHDELVRYLVRHGDEKTAIDAVEAWRADRVVPDNVDVARLMLAENLSVRAVIVRAYPGKVDRKSKEQLLDAIDELRRMAKGK